MASSTSSADAPLSSVTLSSLPAELHSVIARICRDQDRRYKERTSPHAKTRHLEVAKAGATQWDGRSLNALFLVSREWQTAAAPFLFESISSRRCCDSLFVFKILSTFVKHIRHAALDTQPATTTAFVSMLRALPLLVNLRRLSITRSAFYSLLGFGWSSSPPPTSEQHLHREALLAFLPSVGELILDSVEAPHLAWILPHVSKIGLSRLEMAVNLDDTQASAIIQARSALAQLNGLKYLSIRDQGVESHGLLGRISSIAFELESLELLAIPGIFDVHTWSFICRFSGTLHTLTIELDSEAFVGSALAEQADGSRGALVRFSTLRHLHLRGTTTFITTIAHLLSTSPVTTFDITVVGYDHLVEDDRDPLVQVLASAAKGWTALLMTMHVYLALESAHSTSFVRAANAWSMVRQVTQAAPEVVTFIEPRYDAFHNRPKEAGSVGLEKACDAATDTLKFGLDFSDRLLATKDYDGAKALLELLVPLRGKMLREKD